jgi:hypothetical protein
LIIDCLGYAKTEYLCFSVLAQEQPGVAAPNNEANQDEGQQGNTFFVNIFMVCFNSCLL